MAEGGSDGGEGGTSNVGSGMGSGYSESESGVPGGWGATESSQTGGGTPPPPPPPTGPNQYGEMPGGRTYTDPSGAPTTGAGIVDQPGISQFERIQGLSTPGSSSPPPEQPGITPRAAPTPGQPDFIGPVNQPPSLLKYYPAQPGSPAAEAEAARLLAAAQPPQDRTGAGTAPYIPPRTAPEIHQATPEYYATKGDVLAAMALSESAQKSFESAIDATPESGGVKGFVAGAASVFTGLPAFVAGTAFAAEVIAKDPLGTAKVIPAGAAKMGEEFKTQAETNPARFAGTIAGMILMTKAGSIKSPVKGVKIEATAPKTYPEIYSEIHLTPEAARATMGEAPKYTGALNTVRGINPETAAAAGAIAYQGITAESGRHAQPIIGITEQPITNTLSVKIPGTDKTLVLGTPKYTPEGRAAVYGGGAGEQFGGFQSKGGIEYFKNPTELKIATENIINTYDPATQTLFKDVIAKRELTYGTKATHKLNDVPLEEVLTQTHGLKPETAQNVRAYMEAQSQQGELIIWGSSANKALVMGKGGVGYFREIGDIDIHVRNPAATSQELFNIISKTEAPGKVTPKGSAGLATEKGTLFDIKNIEGGAPEGSGPIGSQPSTGDIFGFKREPVDIVGKFQTVSLSEQTTSKLSSVALREQTISAHAGRAGKDPFDLSFINEPAGTKALEQSLNPYTRYIKAPRAKALDIKIQEATTAKIRAQPEGTAPGQITTEQKALYFKNLEAMKAGEPVTSTPTKELLYKAPSGADITTAREVSYLTASAYAAKAPNGSISQVIPPHSPVNIITPEGGRGAQEIARKIAEDINQQYPDTGAYAKGPDIFRGPDKLINMEYFNRTKEERAPDVLFSNGFGSESLTGSPKNALSANYYGSLNTTPSTSGGDAGTYTPQQPYYDVPGTYPSSPGYGQPQRSPGYPGSPGSPRSPGTPSITGGGRGGPGWPPPINKKKKTPEEKKKKRKEKEKGGYFHTFRASPIAEATASLKNLTKSMKIFTKKQKEKK